VLNHVNPCPLGSIPAMQCICFLERSVGCVFERNGLFDLCALGSEALEKFCGNVRNTSNNFSGSINVLKSQGPLSWLFGGGERATRWRCTCVPKLGPGAHPRNSTP